MIDGGVSVIVTIAGLGYAIISGTRLFITPRKKIHRLEGALMIAGELYQIVKKKMPAREAFQISDYHRKYGPFLESRQMMCHVAFPMYRLIDDLHTLDKTRWGHLKNLRKYAVFKKKVIDHCETVKVRPHYTAD